LCSVPRRGPSWTCDVCERRRRFSHPSSLDLAATPEETPPNAYFGYQRGCRRIRLTKLGAGPAPRSPMRRFKPLAPPVSFTSCANCAIGAQAHACRRPARFRTPVFPPAFRPPGSVVPPAAWPRPVSPRSAFPLDEPLFYGPQPADAPPVRFCLWLPNRRSAT